MIETIYIYLISHLGIYNTLSERSLEQLLSLFCLDEKELFPERLTRLTVGLHSWEILSLVILAVGANPLRSNLLLADRNAAAVEVPLTLTALQKGLTLLYNHFLAKLTIHLALNKLLLSLICLHQSQVTLAALGAT